MDFRKAFHTVPRNNLWNRLEELKVPFELRFTAVRLYEKVISNFKNNEGWTMNTNCNIVVKQGFPFSTTLFGIYMDKLERCLEEAGCTGTILAGIIIILLLYVDDIVLMARHHSDLDKKLRILKDFFSNMGMTINTDKTKNMIIKSKKDTYANLIYDNINLNKVTSYTCILEFIFITSSIGIIALRKGLMEGGKLIFVLKIILNQPIWSCGIKRSSSLKLLSSLLSCMVVKYGGATFLKNLGGRLSKSKAVYNL